jgi:hypothetical protein
MGWIGLAGAASGAAVLIFLAPFPRPLRYLIAFSFYFLYQYAVVARPYNFLPLFAFLGAWFYSRGDRAVLPFTATLVLLALVSVQGMAIAGGLAAGYGFRRFRAVSYVLFAVTLALLTILLWPAPGSISINDAGTFSASQHLAKSLLPLGMAFSNFIPASFAIAGAIYIWCKMRRVRSVYLISLLGILFAFGFLRGAAHHVGMVVIGAVTALWCGWPSRSAVLTFTASEMKWHRVSIAALCALFAYQSWWSWSAIRYDWRFPYSGARDAAAYIKSVGADRQSIDCFDNNSVAIMPYFDSNVCANLRTSEGFSFFHTTLETRRRATVNAANLKSAWAVVGLTETAQIPAIEALLDKSGYTLTHVADGTAVFHSDALSEKQMYLIFKRKPGY